MTRSLLVPVLVGALWAAEARAEEVARRAVIVGANHGGSLLESLVYAESDASRMADLLVDLGGFAPEDVTVLLGPTVSDVAVTLYEAAAAADTDGESLFLFYYSGHADEIGLRVNGGLLPYAELKDAIRMVPADVHLGILDACRSGAITKVKGASVAAPFLQTSTLEAEGEAWLAASSDDEDAQESDLLGGSFFTYYLMSGLRGAADTGDGFVSLDEAYRYAYDRTVARTTGTQGGTQHPAYDFRLQGNGGLELTEVRLASARITLPPEIAGEIVVLRLPERTPVAEVAKPDGRPVTVALEPGTYLLRRRVDAGVQEVTVNLSEDSELLVDRWGDTVAEVATLKGGAPGPIVVRVPIESSSVPLEIALPAVDWARLGDSPGLAGGLSVVPGLGHFQQRRWVRGALFMAATVGLYSAGFAAAPEGAPKTMAGPNPLTLLAIGTHGWAIADAAWGARRAEAFAARKGVVVSLESGWSAEGLHASGLSFEFLPVPFLALGLDRAGFVATPESTLVTFGMRAAVGPAWKRFRPAALVTVGSRIDLPRPVDGAPREHADAAFVVGTGALVRVYVTPRYFAHTDLRVEWVDGDPNAVFGLGFGIHLGR